MALMFPRLARNFAKNGYYPTDEITLERALQGLVPISTGNMRIFDPCAGEGCALAEIANALGQDRVQTYAVEYDQERAKHARSMLEHVVHSDLMDTMISRQSFGLIWLNPPYGDMIADHSGASQYQGSGRRRLEKHFYQRCLPLLQYGGVLVFLLPQYVLDDELCGWLCNHFTSLQIYAAVDRQFKQVVIFGIRVRRQDLGKHHTNAQMREHLRAVGSGTIQAADLPITWLDDQYLVPASNSDLQHFYRLSLEPSQFAMEVDRLKGLWAEFALHFSQTGQQPRSPVKALSRWHLALALAAGAISGVVTSSSGRVLALKGNTYKEKSHKNEFTEDEHGNVHEVRILTDRFVPVIRAWDMTPGSPTLGQILTITSAPSVADNTSKADTAQSSGESSPRFHLGQIVTTAAVHHLIEEGNLNPMPFLQRHASGNWGDLPDEDRLSNEQALQYGDRLLSVYDTHIDDEPRLWIITEADRSVTTLLLPSDY